MSLLRAEYRKISRRAVFPVMALVLMAFTGLGALFLIVLGQVGDFGANLPVLKKPMVYAVGAQQAATQSWFPLILAVVLLGGELSTTVWATSLTRDSRKIRHIVSRFVTYSLATIVAVIAGFLVWLFVALFFAPGSGFMSVTDLIGVVWKAALVAVAWTAIGTGAVSMLRSVGPAIGAGLAIYFAESFLVLWGPWENVSLTAASSALFNASLAGPLSNLIPGGSLPLWHQLAIIVGWTALGLFLTWWGLQRRDA